MFTCVFSACDIYGSQIIELLSFASRITIRCWQACTASSCTHSWCCQIEHKMPNTLHACMS